MKSTAPWSIKGIAQDARETAKEAARREGKTLGEWMNTVIYMAGEAETLSDLGGDGGAKMRDIATAVDLLNRRAVSAEEKTLEAVNGLARSLSGVVERVQRLERGQDGGAAGAMPDNVSDRLAAVEEKIADNNRIEALKALEKAVGQVALQFDASHKESLARLDSTEANIQALAERIDNARPAAAPSDAEAIDFLKNAVDGMSSRIARAERIAAEAAKIRSDASNSDNAEFVERTGKRLRVLGDEIKRGGDQIRALEASIARLAGQIDAAEKRSAESVEKVAETISSLRSQLAETDEAERSEAALYREESDAAIAAIAEQTDNKISELHNSFNEIITRLDALKGAPAVANEQRARDDVAPDAVPPITSEAVQDHIARALADDAPQDDETGAEAERIADERSAESSRDLVRSAPASDEDADLELDDLLDVVDEKDDFAFDIEAAPASESAGDPGTSDEPQAADQIEREEILADVRAALGFDDSEQSSASDVGSLLDDPSIAPPKADHEADRPIDAESNAADLDLDDLMAELGGLGDDDANDIESAPPPPAVDELARRKRSAVKKRRQQQAVEDDGVDAASGDEPSEKPDNYLKAARAAAREAAQQAESEAKTKKRRLTPRQRALLAAKAKRKREAGDADDAASEERHDAEDGSRPRKSARRRRPATSEDVELDETSAEAVDVGNADNDGRNTAVPRARLPSFASGDGGARRRDCIGSRGARVSPKGHCLRFETF